MSKIEPGRIVNWDGTNCTVRKVSKTGRRVLIEWWGLSPLDHGTLRSAWVDARSVNPAPSRLAQGVNA